MAQAAAAVSDEEGKKEKGSFTLRARKHEEKKRLFMYSLEKELQNGEEGKGRGSCSGPFPLHLNFRWAEKRRERQKKSEEARCLFPSLPVLSFGSCKPTYFSLSHTRMSLPPPVSLSN